MLPRYGYGVDMAIVDGVGRRLPVAQAARVLGISKNAVYKRVRRGSLHSERGADGRLYVRVPASATASAMASATATDTASEGERHALVEELRDRVRALEEANRENRRLLAAALERIPAIEAPEPRGGPENADEPRPGTETPASDTGQPRAERRASWWRRWFGLG